MACTTVHSDEVYFRDTAHGFLAWAVGVVITAAFLGARLGIHSHLQGFSAQQESGRDPLKALIFALIVVRRCRKKRKGVDGAEAD